MFCQFSFDERVIEYRIPAILITDNGPPFVSECFRTFCTLLWLNTFTSTACDLQTNSHFERYNKTIHKGWHDYAVKPHRF